MQPEDGDRAVDEALVNHVEGAAGHLLLGRLEDQPHPSGQVLPGQRQARTEDDRGVHVMATRVAHARGLRAVANVLLVLHGQRVQVGTEHHEGRTRTDVADQTGAAGEHPRCEPSGPEPIAQQRRRTGLLPPQLGVAVQGATDVDELGPAVDEPLIDVGHTYGRPTANSASKLSTTACRSPWLAAATAR